MAIGWQQLLLILVIVLVLFGGRGKISSLMGDVAKGIKSFRKGLSEDDQEENAAKVSHDKTTTYAEAPHREQPVAEEAPVKPEEPAKDKTGTGQ